jgi:hypothetical protein
MPVHNADIAIIFEEIADLLEIEAANRFVLNTRPLAELHTLIKNTM